MVFLLHVGRLPLAISRIVSRNRILCEAAFSPDPVQILSFWNILQSGSIPNPSKIAIVRIQSNPSSGVTKGGKAGHLLPGAAFWGRQIKVGMLRSNYEISNVSGCYKLRFTKCQMPSDCYQWWRKLFIEVGGPSAWCEGNHFKVGGPGPGNEN